MITVKSLHSLPNAFHFETVMKTLERVGATSVPQQNALLLISPSEELTQLEKVLNQDIKLLEAQLAAGKKKSASGSSGNNGNSGNNGSSDGGTTVIHNEDTIHGLE